MKAYKLTTKDMTTHGDCKWTVGKWKETSGEGDLCGPGWLHYYSDPLLAVLLNPLHADIDGPRLWEIEAEGEHKHDRGLKSGCTKMRLVREIDVPKISNTQRVAFAILCAKAVYKDNAFTVWADGWLSGKDRTIAAASAASAAYAAAYAADAIDLAALAKEAMSYD